MDQTAFDEILISYVQQHEHIYNKSKSSYKDERMKENTWSSIAQELCSDPATVKKRWENLRDRFVRALRESTTPLPTGSGSGGQGKKTPFVFYDTMMWLVPYIRKRKLVSTASAHPNKYCKSSEEFWMENAPIEIDEGSFDTPLIDEEQSSASTSSATGSADSCSSRSIGLSQKAHKSTLQEEVAKAVKSFSEFVEGRKEREPTPNISNSDRSFMNSVVEDMQLIEPKNRIRFKREVLELLEKYIE